MYCCWTSELQVVGGAYPATGELEAVFVAEPCELRVGDG